MGVGKLEVTVSGAAPGNWEMDPVSDTRSVQPAKSKLLGFFLSLNIAGGC